MFSMLTPTNWSMRSMMRNSYLSRFTLMSMLTR